MKKNIFIGLMLTVLGFSMSVMLFPQKALAAEVTGTWIDSAKIDITDDRVTDKDKVLIQTFIDPSPGDSKRHFYVEGVNDDEDPDKCADVFKPSSNNTTGTLERWRGSDRDSLGGGNCHVYNTIDVRLRLADNATEAPSTTNTNATSGTSCESAGPFGWLFCPIINMLDLFLQFLDKSVQGLLSVDDGKYRDEDLKETWAAIRNIAYLILIPVMLVMVIGTALGFSAVDAYTVKKALPRLVIAVMFIALSWEIAGFFIKMSNEIGAGVLGLMTTPLGLADAGRDGITLQDMFSGTFSGGTVLQGATILGIGVAAFTPGVMALVFSFLTTASLIMLTALLVLIARQLFILAIMVFLPLGIIAWIFPGNDKMWKLLWGTFTKLLIMFPLITALIGVGRVFAFIVGNAITDNSAGLEGAVLNPILKVVAYIIPYALIPYTFKAAGGVFGNLVGMANDKEKGLFDRIRKGRQPKIERVGRQVVQRRADWQNRLQTAASNNNRSWAGRKALSFASNRVGGYNIQAADSARRAHVQKEINDQIATGRDDEIRALTVNKRTATIGNGMMRIQKDDATGNEYREYKTLGGAWVKEAAVDAGHARWGKDTYAQQAALSYEMRKAGTEEELQHLATNYKDVATGAWGMSDNAAGGAWIGAAFENQNQHLEYKYTDWNTGQMDAGRAKKFVTEVYEKKGSYPLAQMSSNTIQKLKQAHKVAKDAGDIDTMQKVTGIAETFMHEMGSPGQQIGGGGDDQPIIDPYTGAATPGKRIASTPGAAHVAERVRELAVLSGVKIAEPSGYYAPGHAPDPNNRKQK